MFSRIYVAALLVDEVLADQVWQLWEVGEISDELAAVAWCLISGIDERIRPAIDLSASGAA